MDNGQTNDMDHNQTRPQLIVHIGRDKTGSSRIQNTLFDCRETLQERGIRLIRAGIMGPGNGHAKLYQDAPEILDQIRDEIIEYMREYPTFVISFEGLYYRKSIVKALRKKTQDICDMHIFCYVREQVSFIQSGKLQNLKTSMSRKDSFDIYKIGAKELSYPENLFYGRYLADFAEMSDQLSVCVYDRKLFPNGDIALDFLDWALGVTDIEVPQTNSNKSLSARAAHTQYILNDVIAEEYRRELINILLECDCGESSFFDEETAREVEKNFYEDNKLLKQRFNLRGALKGTSAFRTATLDEINEYIYAQLLPSMFHCFWEQPTLFAGRNSIEDRSLKQRIWKNGGARVQFRLDYELMQRQFPREAIIELDGLEHREKPVSAPFGEHSAIINIDGHIIRVDARKLLSEFDNRLTLVCSQYLNPLELKAANVEFLY